MHHSWRIVERHKNAILRNLEFGSIEYRVRNHHQFRLVRLSRVAPPGVSYRLSHGDLA
jgi:hypothetical protein